MLRETAAIPKLLASGDSVFKTFTGFEFRNHFVSSSVSFVCTRNFTAFTFLKCSCEATETYEGDVLFCYQCFSDSIRESFDSCFSIYFSFVVTAFLYQFDKLCFIH